jgi:hypothetical protein
MMNRMAAPREVVVAFFRTARLAAFALVLALASFAAPAWAQESEVTHDARTMGYPSDNQVGLEGGTAVTWLLFIAVAIVGLSALFKDAKRSHLD